MKYQVVVEGRTFAIEVAPDGRVWVNRRPLRVDLEHIDGLPLYSLLMDHRSFEGHVQEKGEFWVAGRPYQVQVQLKQPHPTTSNAPRTGQVSQVAAPLPGLLLELRVTEGQRVKRGEVVAVLESMKTNLELRAPRSGVVHVLPAIVGQEVAAGQVLAIIGKPPNSERSGHGERGT